MGPAVDTFAKSLRRGGQLSWSLSLPSAVTTRVSTSLVVRYTSKRLCVEKKRRPTPIRFDDFLWFTLRLEKR